MVLYRKKSDTELEEVSALQIRIFDKNAYNSFFAVTTDTNGLASAITRKSVDAVKNSFVDGEVIGIVNHGLFKVSVNNGEADLTEITNDERLREVESKLSSTIGSLNSATSNSVKKSEIVHGSEATQVMSAPLSVNNTFKAGQVDSSTYALQVTRGSTAKTSKTTMQGQLVVENPGDPSVFNGSLTVKGQLAVGSIVFTSS